MLIAKAAHPYQRSRTASIKARSSITTTWLVLSAVQHDFNQAASGSLHSLKPTYIKRSSKLIFS
jgi:hypothetical protein